MEVKAASRCAAGAGRRSGTVGYIVWRLRRRLLALQRGQFAGESAAGARPHRSVDEEESLAGTNACHEENHTAVEVPEGQGQLRACPDCKGKGGNDSCKKCSGKGVIHARS